MRISVQSLPFSFLLIIHQVHLTLLKCKFCLPNPYDLVWIWYVLDSSQTIFSKFYGRSFASMFNAVYCFIFSVRFPYFEKERPANSIISWVVQSAMDVNVAFNNYRRWAGRSHENQYLFWNSKTNSYPSKYSITKRFLQTSLIISSKFSSPGL